ncbi:MAG: hypothetical protein OEZ02_14690, partial [Anaerolineae bacterium]|nr:hypothetical protein [Anaerolineae bacterium]
PPAPFSPPGPTHEGQPSRQLHAATSAYARSMLSSCSSNSRSFRSSSGHAITPALVSLFPCLPISHIPNS